MWRMAKKEYCRLQKKSLPRWYVFGKENGHFRLWYFLVLDPSKQISLFSNWIFVCKEFLKTTVHSQRSPDHEAMQREKRFGLSLCQPPKARQLHDVALSQGSCILLCWLPTSSSGVLHSINILGNGRYRSSPRSSTKPLLKHEQLNPKAI